MADRFQSVKRILAVQTQLHRLAEWKLATLDRTETALQERQEHLLRFLNGETSYAAVFGAALMRRLHNIEEQKARVAAAKKQQTELTLEELRRVGRMQRTASELAGKTRQESERKELRDVLELIHHRRSASLR